MFFTHLQQAEHTETLGKTRHTDRNYTTAFIKKLVFFGDTWIRNNLAAPWSTLQTGEANSCSDILKKKAPRFEKTQKVHHRVYNSLPILSLSLSLSCTKSAKFLVLPPESYNIHFSTIIRPRFWSSKFSLSFSFPRHKSVTYFLSHPPPLTTKNTHPPPITSRKIILFPSKPEYH